MIQKLELESIYFHINKDKKACDFSQCIDGLVVEKKENH